MRSPHRVLTRRSVLVLLKPLERSDYNVTFTDEHWARLQGTFSTGVCDWSKPGVGMGPNIPWLTYEDGPGGEPLGPTPSSSRSGGGVDQQLGEVEERGARNA